MLKMFGTTLNNLIAWKVIYFFVYRELHNLKEQCHEDFAVLGQFRDKIITLRL